MSIKEKGYVKSASNMRNLMLYLSEAPQELENQQ